MMDIEKFTFYVAELDVTHDVRAFLVDDEPWFVAADVCAVLDLPNVSMALSRLDEDDISSTDVISPYGTVGATRRQTVRTVNESGLYTLILRSDKPEAKEFQRWVTRVVLPTIRQTGGFLDPERIDINDPAQLATVLRAGLEAAERLEEANRALEIVRPRAVSAIGAESRMEGQALWDLRYAGADKFGIDLMTWLKFCAYLGAIEKRGSVWYVRPGWDDLLFNTPVTQQPQGVDAKYTYAYGPIRVRPGKQAEMMDRLDRAYQQKMFSTSS